MVLPFLGADIKNELTGAMAAPQTSSTGHFDIPSLSSETMQRTRGQNRSTTDRHAEEKKKLAQRFDISRCFWRSGSDVESVLVDMHSGGFASTRCASREPRKKGWLRVALLSPVLAENYWLATWMGKKQGL